MTEKNYKALLTVTEFPKTTRGKERMYVWLTKVADQILEAKPEEYAETVRFRMMK